MKKCSILICFLLVLSLFVSCGEKKVTAEEASSAIVGKWVYANYGKYKDILQDVIEEDIFYDVYYTFNADGTGCTGMEGGDNNLPGDVLLTFSYVYDGATLTVTFEDGTTQNIPCTIKGKELTVIYEDENEEIVFEKQ